MPVGLSSTFVRLLLRCGGRLSGRERASFLRLRAKAQEVRNQYIAKPFPRNNVAVLECVSLGLQQTISVEATSHFKSPSPLPLPRSKGGYFEPSFDLHLPEPRLMDTDSEYKALSELARRLDETGTRQKIGVVYLFTERKPCGSCQRVIDQFKERFPLLYFVVKFDHPYP
jgi:The  BURPS668_1122 family of deaminases